MDLSLNRKRWHIMLGIFAAAAVMIVIYRTLSVFYSITATDVVYQNTIWPLLLNYAANFLSFVSQALCFAGIAYANFRIYGNARRLALVFSLVCLTIEQISALFVDIFSGDISQSKELAALWSIGTILYFWLFDIVAYFIANRYSRKYSRKNISEATRRNSSPYAAVRASVYVLFGVHMAMLIYRILSFFIEYDFYVTPTEIAAIIGDVINLIVNMLIIPGIVGACAMAVADKAESKWTQSKKDCGKAEN